MPVANIDNGLECCLDINTLQSNNISVHNFNKQLNNQQLKDEMNLLLELESHVSLLDCMADSDLIFNSYINLNNVNLRNDYDDEELNESNKFSFGYNCRNELQNNILITESTQLLNMISNIIDIGIDIKLNKTYGSDNSINIYLNGNEEVNKEYGKDCEMNSCNLIADSNNTNKIDVSNPSNKEDLFLSDNDRNDSDKLDLIDDFLSSFFFLSLLYMTL